MNLAAVAVELGEHLSSIPDWMAGYVGPPDAVVDPCFVIPLPDEVMFDATYSNGSSRATWAVLVIVGRVDDSTVMERTVKYLSDSGAYSVRQALDSVKSRERGDPYTACGDVRVAGAQLSIVTWQGIDFQGVEFQLEIMG